MHPRAFGADDPVPLDDVVLDDAGLRRAGRRVGRPRGARSVRQRQRFGAGTTIISSVAQLTPSPPSLEALQERWELTPQEARVALLLAQGYSNARIAAELQLGPTTTRHYTEAVFLKLRVHSRAEAARRILVE